MSENKEKINLKVLILSTLLFLIAFSLSGYFYYNVSSDYNNLKQINYFELKETQISENAGDIYDYYSLASNSYDYSDYDMAIYYCEESRDISSKYSQELRNLKAEYPEDLNDILRLRKEMINKEIDYLFALYESCEYIESASRAYSIGDYNMGDINIDGQNTAINRHDTYVEDYYNLMAQYNKKRLEMLE